MMGLFLFFTVGAYTNTGMIYFRGFYCSTLPPHKDDYGRNGLSTKLHLLGLGDCRHLQDSIYIEKDEIKLKHRQGKALPMNG